MSKLPETNEHICVPPLCGPNRCWLTRQRGLRTASRSRARRAYTRSTLRTAALGGPAWLRIFAVMVVMAGAVFYMSRDTSAVHDDGFQLEGNVTAADTTFVDIDPGMGGGTETPGDLCDPDLGFCGAFDWTDIFDNSGNSLPPANGFVISDFVVDFRLTAGGTFDVTDPSTFTGGGSKDINDVPDWSCVEANNVTNKGDIINAYVTIREVGGQRILYFGIEKQEGNGDNNVGLWLFQGEVGCEEGGSGNGNSFTGAHEDHDLFLVAEVTNGGGVSSIIVYEWLGGALTATGIAGVDCLDTAVGDNVCAVTNGKPIQVPWPHVGAGGAVGAEYEKVSFLEGGINLSAFDQFSDTCFTDFLFNTRSSQETTAQLFDYALGDIGSCGISVVKEGDELSKVGDPAHYAVTVTNDSIGATLHKQSIEDSVFGDIDDAANPLLSNYSSTCGASLAAGASCTIEFDYVVQEGDPDPLENTVTAIYNDEATLDGTEFSASDDHSLNLFQPSVTIDKTGDELSKVGDTVNYEITVENTSSDDSPDLVCVVNDTILGEIDGDLTLAPGASQVYNPTYIVQGGDPDPLVNTATVTCSPEGFPNILEDEDDHSVDLFQPSVTIEKEGASLGKVGDEVEYTITVTNTSSADSPDLVCTVNDTLLGEIDGDLTLASGANQVYSPTYVVQEGDPDPLVNTATVTCSPEGFPNVLTDEDSHSVNLFQPSVTIDKTGDELSKVGDDVDYTITVTNTSSGDSPNLVCNVTDSLIGDIDTGVNLAPGANAVYNRTRTVEEGDPDPLVNTATVTCSPVGFPNILTDEDDHSVNLFQPSVTIEKTGPDFTKAGDENLYDIVVTNTSSADTPDLVCNVTDSLLGIVDTDVTIASGGSESYLGLPYTTQAGDPDPLVNTATVNCSPEGFPNVVSDEDSHSADVLHPAFTLGKVCKAEPIEPAGPAVFTITFNNTGDADLDVVPDEGAPFSVAAGGSFSYDHNIAGPFDGQASVSNIVNVTVTLDPQYNLSNTFTDSASAECDVAEHVTVLKTTQGVESSDVWTFRLYTGPDGFDSGALLATDMTPPALLDFGNIVIDPTNTYTVCEEDVPAGWTSTWMVDTDNDGIADTLIGAYNPNADDPTPEDLGNRCVDFGAGTTIPIPAGGTLVFAVDNTRPEGDARTPGYWKNWNSCSGGRQYQTALNHGGGAEGYWTVDELLALFPGTFVVGDLIIDNCDDAVNILDKSDLSGKKKANDAAYNLATALLAYEFNIAAGAGTCAAATTAAADAQALLDLIDFDGMGNYLGPKVKNAAAVQRQQALTLQGILDDYNNNVLC